MAPVHSKYYGFADADDSIMVEAVVKLLKRGVDVDDVFRMVRSSDWNWENEAIPSDIVSNRNLYVRIVKLVQKRGRIVFASSSYKNRFKRIMDDGRGIDHVIERNAKIFSNEDSKKSFRELYRKWHTERSPRNCRGRSRGVNGGGISGLVFDWLGDKEQPVDNLSDGEKTVIMEVEDTGTSPPPVSNQRHQPEEKNVLLTSTERQAIIKMIAELLQNYSHQDVLNIVMKEDWTNGSVLNAKIAFLAQQQLYLERPYEKYWKKKVVPLMLSWNGKVNPCVFRTDTAPVYLTQWDLLAVRDFVREFRNKFLTV